MRILVVIYEFPPVGGGGGFVARDICRELVKLGHETHVLSAHVKGLPRQETLDGIRIIRLPSARKSPYEAGLVPMSGYVLAGLWASFRYVRDWQPDVIHVHFAVPSGPVAWALSRRTGIPYVLTAHLGDVPGGVPDKTDRWFRLIFPFTPPIWRDAARVVAISEHTRDLAVRYYPVEVQVIPNGVYLDQFTPGKVQHGNPPLIAFAGRFVPQKNPLLLVNTLAQLQDLDWRCIMMGDGPLHEKVRSEIERLNLENRISLPGWITPEEVIQRLSSADILFMPSRSEGLPLVGIKSLALGLAIVGSNVGGLSDLVEDGQNGYLVSGEDPKSFSTPMREVLTNKQLLSAFQESSLEVAKQFDVRRIALAYEELFQAVAVR